MAAATNIPSPSDQVKEFNEKYSVNSPVAFISESGHKVFTHVRFPAEILNNGTTEIAVVWVSGLYNAVKLSSVI